MPVALITGAARGPGPALSRALTDRGRPLVVDARDTRAPDHAASELRARADVIAVAGDVAELARGYAVDVFAPLGPVRAVLPIDPSEPPDPSAVVPSLPGPLDRRPSGGGYRVANPSAAVAS